MQKREGPQSPVGRGRWGGALLQARFEPAIYAMTVDASSRPSGGGQNNNGELYQCRMHILPGRSPVCSPANQGASCRRVHMSAVVALPSVGRFIHTVVVVRGSMVGTDRLNVPAIDTFSH